MVRSKHGHRVRDLMVPLDQYTTIGAGENLAGAFAALQRALAGAGRADPDSPRDFAVLVVDAGGQVTGRLVVWDILQGLEPQRRRGIDALAMIDGLGAWRRPLANLATKARDVKVRDLLRRLDRTELIDADALLDEAVHRLIKLRTLSLIVTEEERSVGVLRVVDVFDRVNRLVQGDPRDAG